MEGIIADRGLRRGPDFFTAYAVEKERYYGSDPVHPNIEGMRRMADLWAAALAGGNGSLAAVSPTQ
jgi:lysophospholipase L1-like esterase